MVDTISRNGLDVIFALAVALIYVIGGIASSPGSPVFFNAEKDRRSLETRK